MTELPTPIMRSPLNSNSPHLVMCPPDYYSVAYRINPWMDPESWSVSAAQLEYDARVGWQSLRETYESLDATIEILAPQKGWPDLVFTANAAVVLDRKVTLARFLHKERQGEQAYVRAFFNELKSRGIVDEIFNLPDELYFEGAGDAVFDAGRRLFWAGWRQRSSLGASDALRKIYDIPTIALELVDPRFYHLDTAFCVLPGGEVMYVPGAFTDTGRQSIRELVGSHNMIAVPDADAEMLAANSVSIGRNVVFGACGAALKKTLNDRGYVVHTVPLGSFGRSGGSAYCLTLRLDNMSR